MADMWNIHEMCNYMDLDYLLIFNINDSDLRRAKQPHRGMSRQSTIRIQIIECIKFLTILIKSWDTMEALRPKPLFDNFEMMSPWNQISMQKQYIKKLIWMGATRNFKMRTERGGGASW
jgi:hypothetical protein